MVYNAGEEQKIKRELGVRDRANKLSDAALRAALLSIKDVDELERVVKIGEDYMDDVYKKRQEWMNKGMEIALRKDLEDETQPG